jgi:outer membrane PBP1 activator LpoA protein
MNARQQITNLLKEWLEKTRSEAHAIQVGRWSDLAKIQNAKAALQQPLTDAIEQWKTENPEEAALNSIRHEINRLFALESHNSELLALRKREVREKLLLIEQALYDLRHLRSPYAQTPEAA